MISLVLLYTIVISLAIITFPYFYLTNYYIIYIINILVSSQKLGEPLLSNQDIQLIQTKPAA